MKVYSCPRCNYTSSLKTNLKRHFMKKKSCIVTHENVSITDCLANINAKTNKFPENSLKNSLKNPENSLKNPENSLKTLKNTDPGKKSFVCGYCDKVFSRKDNLKVHLKSYCKNIMGGSNDECPQLRDNKDVIIDELKSQIEVLLTKVGNTTNNTTNNTINININAYGKENIDYITTNIITKLVEYGPYKSIPKLLKQIHFNPKHKENHNVKIPNRKEKYAKIYTGDKWELRDKKETIEDLSDKAYNILEDHYEGGNKRMDRFIEDYDGNGNIAKKVHKDTELMILNNQNLEDII